jgi:maltooligosyltrehalose trehalohydrolase
MTWAPSIGAWPGEGRACFRVWAPSSTRVTLEIDPPSAPRVEVACAAGRDGMFEAQVPDLAPGARYRYRLDDRGPFPDPASRFQPEGVHGPSAFVDPRAYAWHDGGWRGLTRDRLVIYELHVGTFSPEGTFAAVAARLPLLAGLGVTAIELMPIADFPGNRSWGYDGAALFAPARCYGAPDDLRALVDEAHRLGLAVILDVVYNHLGPDGAYANAFSPYYFRKDRITPWGEAVNLDGDRSRFVRDFFIENAIHWVREYHVDGLRLDATHAMEDESPVHFLAELTARVKSATPQRETLVIAEDDRNLAHIARPRERGGFGLDAVWADDFHHQVRRATTGDHEGYFQDFTGSTRDLATTIDHGWFFSGQHSAFRGAPRGTGPEDLEYDRFVVAVQNHDQVGNRAFGERLHHHVDAATWRALTVLLLTVPETPLLFMGQEWACSTPFLFFTDHHPELGRLVTEGRRREFGAFAAFRDPAERLRIPDPQAPATFAASKLRWDEREREPHASALRCCRAVLALRRREPALQVRTRGRSTACAAGHDVILVRRDDEAGEALLVAVCLRGPAPLDVAAIDAARLPRSRRWETILSTEDEDFTADGQPPAIDDGRDVRTVSWRRAGAVVLAARPRPGP